MSNHDEQEQPAFGKVKRDWVTLYRVVIIIFSLFSAGGVTVLVYSFGSYIQAEAATQVKVEMVPVEKRFTDGLAPLIALPGRVERLEDFRLDQRKTQEQTTLLINTIQQDLATIRTLQSAQNDESRRNTERILTQLDRLSRTNTISR